MILLIGGLIYPALDDFGIVVSGVSSTVMVIAVPYRIRELRSLTFTGTIGEWFIPILGLFQFLACCAAVLVRVESPHRFISPWSTIADLEEAFNMSTFVSVKAFVNSHVSCTIEENTVAGAYRCLKLREEGEKKASSTDDTELEG
jgi:hypothetical protein